MINDKAILVGVDGSHASYKATWWAANYAKHAGLTLQIVCAYSLPSYAAVSFDATYTAMGDDNAAHNDAQEILSKAKAIADEGVKAATLIVTGDPASVFVELSRNYNLIVIGNRGKGGLAERLLGTTSSSLPAYAYCPIVVVPYTDDEGNLMHLNNKITRVAVGSDESKWGLKALEIAADFASSWKAQLDVISAVPNVKGAAEDKGVMDSYMDDLAVRIKPIEQAHPDLEIHKEIVPGNAVETLTKASYDHDVVVVGSRGRGGFTGLLLGSTSQGLLQHAVSPVYVVPRKYVEAAESQLDTVPSSPADVPTKPIDDISGVEAVQVPTAGAEQASAIDSKIDPEHK